MSDYQASLRTQFTDFQKKFDEDYEVREAIKSICKDIGQILREATTLLQVIHFNESAIIPACGKAREKFESSRAGFAKLKEAVPPKDYYKYQEQWRNMLQRFCFLIALTDWLETGTLTSLDTCAQVLGITCAIERQTGFHLDIEDYLSGLLQLCSELSRLSVNAATRGDFVKPLEISKFVMELNAGFSLLTLKNDHLRKRLDVLKYDMKKIEEVVYDISIRGLGPEKSGCVPE